MEVSVQYLEVSLQYLEVSVQYLEDLVQYLEMPPGGAEDGEQEDVVGEGDESAGPELVEDRVGVEVELAGHSGDLGGQVMSGGGPLGGGGREENN